MVSGLVTSPELQERICLEEARLISMASKLLMSIIWVRFRSRGKRGVVGSRGGTRGFLAIARSMARPVWCSRPPRDGSRGRGLRLRLLRRVFDRHLPYALQ